MFYKGKVRRKYIRVLHREQPVRCAIPTNPSPYQQFVWAIEGIKETLDQRSIDYNERFVYRILDHLLDKWPGGITRYNMHYVMHTAVGYGMLDKHFNPIKGSCFVNEERARIQHIVRTGGVGALNSYLEG